MHLRVVGELRKVIARQFSLSSLKDHGNLGTSLKSGKRQKLSPSSRQNKRIWRTIDRSVSYHSLGRLLCKSWQVFSSHKKENGNSKNGSTKDKLCLTLLTAFYDEITCSVDQGRAEEDAYLDFSKTFDVVYHRIPTEKLVKYKLLE